MGVPIRDQLEPLIREVGLAETTRRANAIDPECNLRRPYLSAWLLGRGHMNDRRVDAICEALGVELRACRGGRYIKPQKGKGA